MKDSKDFIEEVNKPVDNSASVEKKIVYGEEEFVVQIFTELTCVERTSIIDNSVENVLSIDENGDARYVPSFLFLSFWANVVSYTTDIEVSVNPLATERMLNSSNLIDEIKKVYPDGYFENLYTHFLSAVEFRKNVIYNSSRFDGIAKMISNLLHSIYDKFGEMSSEDLAGVMRDLLLKEPQAKEQE